MDKKEGVVKSFNPKRGFGFIIDKNNDEYFFYFKSLNMKGFKTINVETKVKFVEEVSEKGKRAVDIDIISK